MTNEAAVCKTERTFSQAQVVSDDTEMKVCVLILCEELSEKVESSVEAVVESDLVNAPVAPVFDVLYSSRVSVKTESNESVLEFSLYVLDEDRGIERESLDTHIVHCVDELTYLLTHIRIELVLIHRKRIDKVIERDIALLTFLYVISELIHIKVRNDGSCTASRKTVVLELSEEARDGVLLVILIDEIEQLVIEVTAKIEGYRILIHVLHISLIIFSGTIHLQYLVFGMRGRALL